jgi:hypothetical protein
MPSLARSNAVLELSGARQALHCIRSPLTTVANTHDDVHASWKPSTTTKGVQHIEGRSHVHDFICIELPLRGTNWLHSSPRLLTAVLNRRSPEMRSEHL